MIDHIRGVKLCPAQHYALEVNIDAYITFGNPA
jgi:hypothetical protein